MDATGVGRLVALVLTVTVVLGTFSGVAAAETRSGGAIVVGPDEVITDGLDAFGGSVLVQGTVRGDLNAFAGEVRIAEGARVTGDLNAFGGTVSVAGTVGGDLNTAAGTVTLAESSVVEGAVAIGSGTVVLAGTVNGDVEAGAETLVLGETARLSGDLRYDAESFRNEGGVVDGRIVRDATIADPQPVVVDPQLEGALDVLFGVYALLVNLLLGVLLLALLPAFSGRVTGQAVRDPLRSGGYGLLALVGVPVVLVLVAVTVIGIPISLVGALAFAVLVWVAAVYGRIAVGRWLLGYLDSENRWAALLVGVVVVALAVRVPVVGSVVDVVVLVLGLGAFSLSVYRSYRGESGEPDAEAPEPDTDEGARPA